MMLVPLVGIIPLVIAVAIAVALYFIPVQGAISPLVTALLVTITIIGIATFVYITAWGQAGLLLQIIHRSQNKQKPFKETLREARPFVPSLIWTGFLSVLCILAGLVAFIIPGIALIIYLTFVQWVVINNKGKGVEALKQSFRLVRGNFWPVAVRWLGVMIIITIIVGIPQSALTEGTLAFNVYNGLVNVLSFVFGPLVTIYLYQIYQDLAKAKPAA